MAADAVIRSVAASVSDPVPTNARPDQPASPCRDVAPVASVAVGEGQRQRISVPTDAAADDRARHPRRCRAFGGRLPTARKPRRRSLRPRRPPRPSLPPLFIGRVQNGRSSRPPWDGLRRDASRNPSPACHGRARSARPCPPAATSRFVDRAFAPCIAVVAATPGRSAPARIFAPRPARRAALRWPCPAGCRADADRRSHLAPLAHPTDGTPSWPGGS